MKKLSSEDNLIKSAADSTQKTNKTNKSSKPVNKQTKKKRAQKARKSTSAKLVEAVDVKEAAAVESVVVETPVVEPPVVEIKVEETESVKDNQLFEGLSRSITKELDDFPEAEKEALSSKGSSKEKNKKSAPNVDLENVVPMKKTIDKKFFKRELLKCPACNCTRLERRKHDEFTCPKCEHKYEIREGIPFLLTDLELATQLESIDYDAHHRIDLERRLAAYDLWEKVFHEHETGYGDVLEIGSGTGQLTWSLINRFPFSSVHAVDISYKFLKGIQDNLVESPGADVSYTVCDANNLPYNDGKFDLVIGHSVLHHFLDYDKTVGRVRHLLRKGGQAIFFEPVLQGKIWVAFFADLMLRIERNTKTGILDRQDQMKLQRLINHLTKAHKVGGDREALSRMEDKYIFDINKMKKLAFDLGYRDFAYSNSEAPKWGFRDNFIHHLLLAGLDAQKIQKFTYMNTSFGETFSNLLPDDVKTPMGFFVFKN